LKAVFPNCEPK
jgi:NAD(P)-dependent dehydrogenase (short-subunit alcohol dehydrogenase family)